MGGAIAKALAKKGQKVFVYDKNFAKAKFLGKAAKIFADLNVENLFKADFIILAVKPYHMTEAADDVRGKIKSSAIIISIAAGVRIFKIQKIFGHKKILRMMPNLGLAVGQGIAGWTSASLNNREKAVSKKLLNLITENFEVKNENQLDAVTAISGSGPAYFFQFAAGLEKAAKDLKFDKITARRLAEKTFSAAAALQVGQGYDQLIKQVASKKGTTERAIKSFQTSNLNRIVKKAVTAAHKRAKEISND